MCSPNVGLRPVCPRFRFSEFVLAGVRAIGGLPCTAKSPLIIASRSTHTSYWAWLWGSAAFRPASGSEPFPGRIPRDGRRFPSLFERKRRKNLTDVRNSDFAERYTSVRSRWGTEKVQVPQADLLLQSNTIYSMTYILYQNTYFSSNVTN